MPGLSLLQSQTATPVWLRESNSGLFHKGTSPRAWQVLEQVNTIFLARDMVSFNLYNIPKRKVLCVPGNRGSQRLNNVTKNRHLQTAELDLNPSLSKPQVHVLPIIPYCTNDSPFRQFGQKEINVAASCSKAHRRSVQRSKSHSSSHSKAGRQARSG